MTRSRWVGALGFSMTPHLGGVGRQGDPSVGVTQTQSLMVSNFSCRYRSTGALHHITCAPVQKLKICWPAAVIHICLSNACTDTPAPAAITDIHACRFSAASSANSRFLSNMWWVHTPTPGGPYGSQIPPTADTLGPCRQMCISPPWGHPGG